MASGEHHAADHRGDGGRGRRCPALTVTGTAGGLEHMPLPLTISGALADTDGSESLSFLIGGIPSGATFSNRAGDPLAVSNDQLVLTPAQLAGLQITPPAHRNGAFNLTVTARATEAANGDQATTASQTNRRDDSGRGRSAHADGDRHRQRQ